MEFSRVYTASLISYVPGMPVLNYQLNLIDIVVSNEASLPPPKPVQAGTIAYAVAEETLFVLVVDPSTNVHTWNPVVGAVSSFVNGAPILYKFAAGISVADMLDHTASMADDAEFGSDEGLGIVYLAVSDTTLMRVRVDVIQNTSDTTGHVDILVEGSVVATVPFAAGFVGKLGIDVSQAVADSDELRVNLVKDAGGAGGPQLLQATVNVLLHG